MKFGTMTHLDPLDRSDPQNFENVKTKMVAVAIVKN